MLGFNDPFLAFLSQWGKASSHNILHVCIKPQSLAFQMIKQVGKKPTHLKMPLKLTYPLKNDGWFRCISY